MRNDKVNVLIITCVYDFFRILLKLPRWTSANHMLVPTFYFVLRKFIY